jgi:hypothetical protein
MAGRLGSAQWGPALSRMPWSDCGLITTRPRRKPEVIRRVSLIKTFRHFVSRSS